MKFKIGLILIFIFGCIMVSYKDYARKNGLTIGDFFNSDTGIPQAFATFTIIGSIVAGFILIKWYWVLVGLIAGWIVSQILIAIFKEASQVFSILILLVGVIILLVSIFT